MESRAYFKQAGVQAEPSACIGLHAAQNHSRTIRCTPENAAQMRQVVQHWPEMLALVQSLQAQGLFPGLRGLEITLTGAPEYLDKGLAALIPENAPQRSDAA